MTQTPYIRPVSLAECNTRNIVQNLYQLTNFVNNRAVGTISAKDYGAVGDGVTDDTKALQKWANAISALGPAGFSGHLPAGTYAITSSITFTGTDINISGDGMSQSSFSMVANPAVDALIIGTNSFISNTTQLLDFGIFVAHPAASTYAIHIKNRGGAVLERVLINAAQIGIIFDTQCFSPRVNQCVIENTAGAAIVFTHDNSANNACISNNFIFSCGNGTSDYAIEIPDGTGILIRNNDIEGCFGGILFKETLSLTILGNFIERSGNGGNIFCNGSGTASTIISGNLFGTSVTVQLGNLAGGIFSQNTLFNFSVTWQSSTVTEFTVPNDNNLSGTATLGAPPAHSVYGTFGGDITVDGSNKGRVITSPIAFSSLPSASSFPGYRSMISNASQTSSGNFGIAATSSTGTNTIPVFSDGTTWRIG